MMLAAFWMQTMLRSRSVYAAFSRASGDPLPGDLLLEDLRTGSRDPLHRKSLYIYWRRMALHPTMELLDAPSRAVCTARRNTANLPTQALVTLNDPIFLEAASAFAKRILSEAPEDNAARLELAFRLGLCRKPDNEERVRFLTFIEEQTKRYADDISAAWTSVATVLMNLDETLNRP